MAGLAGDRLSPHYAAGSGTSPATETINTDGIDDEDTALKTQAKPMAIDPNYIEYLAENRRVSNPDDPSQSDPANIEAGIRNAPSNSVESDDLKWVLTGLVKAARRTSAFLDAHDNDCECQICTCEQTGRVMLDIRETILGADVFLTRLLAILEIEDDCFHCLRSARRMGKPTSKDVPPTQRKIVREARMNRLMGSINEGRSLGELTEGEYHLIASNRDFFGPKLVKAALLAWTSGILKDSKPDTRNSGDKTLNALLANGRKWLAQTYPNAQYATLVAVLGPGIPSVVIPLSDASQTDDDAVDEDNEDMPAEVVGDQG